MKLLIIEDNEYVAMAAKKRLGKWYTVDTAFSGEEGLDLLSKYPYDLVLLDLGLPGITGQHVCTQIRRFWPETAILIITGEGATPSKLALFNEGADDYLQKPYDAAELLARVRALLRRRQNSTYQTKITVGPLVIDPESRTVTRDGLPIELRRKEYNILECLCLNPGRIMTREMIVHKAWPAASNDWTGSVDVHIKQLRDKIDRPFEEKLLATVYGLGYMIQPPQTSTQEQSNQA